MLRNDKKKNQYSSLKWNILGSMLSASSFLIFSSKTHRTTSKDKNYIFIINKNAGGTMFITCISSNYSDATMF